MVDELLSWDHLDDRELTQWSEDLSNKWQLQLKQLLRPLVSPLIKAHIDQKAQRQDAYWRL